MAKERKIGRQKAVSDLKRELILDAARKVFRPERLTVACVGVLTKKLAGELKKIVESFD